MGFSDPTIAEAWLKLVPEGYRCDNGKGCEYSKRNYMIRGGKIVDWWCSMYHLEPKNGRKVQMCREVWDLEELKHLKRKK